jgi:hypothetical protein
MSVYEPWMILALLLAFLALAGLIMVALLGRLNGDEVSVKTDADDHAEHREFIRKLVKKYSE